MGMEEGGYTVDKWGWRKGNTELTRGWSKGDTDVITGDEKRGLQR